MRVQSSTLCCGNSQQEPIRPFQSTKQQLLPLEDEAIRSPNRVTTNEDSFFVANLESVARQFHLWTAYMPSVYPFYAVKCNSDLALLRRLAWLGTGFDCASEGEMRRVLALGVHPNRIILANPCKASSTMMFAAQAGVSLTTFDNHSELHNIKAFMPNARLLLRIFAEDKTSLVALSDKYGVREDGVKPLLERACVLDLNIVGITFHIGSGNSDPEALRTAIQSSRRAWAIANSLGISLSILDIGGGFRQSQNLFLPMAKAATQAIAEAQFPANVKLIAEPGRFLVRGAYTLFCQVISVRQPTEQSGPPEVTGSPRPGMLYQNDGVYKSFMNRLVEKEIFNPLLVRMSEATARSSSYSYSIWGPTCDSTDCVSQREDFSHEIQPGDWLVYRNMGAYTLSTATNFNGFTGQIRILYVDEDIQGHASLRAHPWRNALYMKTTTGSV